ncbi:MAG: hypothetical protein KDC73_03205 [Ignavibacteriae bacterium]|nr:hypothetical protein [Ignavibacteriota bacterium]MCB9244272.1 hypothetical protein [Ignavibacteriales bacterium]
MPEQNQLREIYALIWRANEPDETFKQEEFDSRIPQLMEWLKELYSKGKLAGCGGGGFENHAGGLTLLNADNIEEAQELSKGSPMNEIGTTEIMIWDIFYADLVERSREEKLK